MVQRKCLDGEQSASTRRATTKYYLLIMDYRVVSLLMIMATSCLSAAEPRALSCPCPKIYLPLCASDGNTYNNMCEFECRAKQVRNALGAQLFVISDDPCDR